jgi:hypothetical protein
MDALKLFISHSSGLDETDAEDRPLSTHWDLLSDTCKALRTHYGNRIEILVDYEGLKPASQWRARLDSWLGECDAAIILFSRRAVQTSKWVQFEASVLRWRSSRDPAFRLLPVLLAGQTDAADLESDVWNTIGISSTQCVRSAASAGDVLVGVRAALGGLEQPDHRTAFGKRFAAIKTLISECSATTVTEHANALRAVWEAIADGATLPTWPDDALGRYALGLTRLLLEDTANSMRTFARIVEEMAPPLQRPLDLFKYVRPLWVDPAAADCLKIGQAGSCLLALNGDFVMHSDPVLDTRCYTLDRYRERAFLQAGVRIVQSPRSDPDSVRDELRTSEDKQWARYPQKVHLVDARVRKLGSPIIALLPATDGLPDPRLFDDLKRLREEACPKLIYVFATGASMPGEIPDEIRPVRPELDTETEYNQYQDECHARQALAGN